jgi:hypothetical protein
MSGVTYSPGSLVRARGREWIVLTGSDRETLRVRPISGSEEDQTLIHLALEAEPSPRPPSRGPTHASGRPRRCAAPARRAAAVAAARRRPVPRLRADRGRTPRLPARPAADGAEARSRAPAHRRRRRRRQDHRGRAHRPRATRPRRHRAARRAVPAAPRRAVGGRARGALPHPCRWQSPRRARVAWNAPLPPSESIFSACPHTVVSLDYIKSERRRAEFLRACPEFVIVDEAHTCARPARGATSATIC